VTDGNPCKVFDEKLYIKQVKISQSSTIRKKGTFLVCILLFYCCTGWGYTGVFAKSSYNVTNIS
jgi:hypothetical protein